MGGKTSHIPARHIKSKLSPKGIQELTPTNDGGEKNRNLNIILSLAKHSHSVRNLSESEINKKSTTDLTTKDSIFLRKQLGFDSEKHFQ